MKRSSIIWLILICLSIISAVVGDFNELNTELVIVVLVLLSLKGQLIVDHFMELREVKWFWRLILSAFCPVLSVAIFFSWQATA